MKVSVLQPNLKRGLAVVSHAVAGKSTLPVLAHILLAAEDDRLKLAATNLEIGLTCWIGAKVAAAGTITLPAKLLFDVVSALPSELVTLELDERTQSVHLICGRYEATIKGITADEFPAIPTIADRDDAATIPAAALRTAIDQVAVAAATEDTRPVLAGVHLLGTASTLQLTAADGFRLARKRVDLPTPLAAPFEVIVPARALSQLGRLLGDVEGEVAMRVTPSGGLMLFRTESIELVSRLVEGKFPDADRVIPAASATRAILNVAALRQLVRLAKFFAVASSNIVRLTVAPNAAGPNADGPGTLTISANAAEVGDNTGVIDALVHGDGGQIAFNVLFLETAIGAVSAKEVALATATPQSPGLFTPVGDETYQHVLMPMSVR